MCVDEDYTRGTQGWSAGKREFRKQMKNERLRLRGDSRLWKTLTRVKSETHSWRY